jgi:hypothetical protein
MGPSSRSSSEQILSAFIVSLGTMMEHLAQAFIYITDQIGITSKVVLIIASETQYANLW